MCIIVTDYNRSSYLGMFNYPNLMHSVLVDAHTTCSLVSTIWKQKQCDTMFWEWIDLSSNYQKIPQTSNMFPQNNDLHAQPQDSSKSNTSFPLPMALDKKGHLLLNLLILCHPCHPMYQWDCLLSSPPATCGLSRRALRSLSSSWTRRYKQGTSWPSKLFGVPFLPQTWCIASVSHC